MNNTTTIEDLKVQLLEEIKKLKTNLQKSNKYGNIKNKPLNEKTSRYLAAKIDRIFTTLQIVNNIQKSLIRLLEGIRDNISNNDIKKDILEKIYNKFKEWDDNNKYIK